MAAIPLSWNDPLFSGVTNSGSVTLNNGGTLSNKSITETGDTASVVGVGSFSLDHVRINSQEGVRIGGSGDINISNSYIETTGVGADHADGIQAYAPGGTGNVTITNTTIVSHNTAATAGMFIADDYSGTFTFNNVVFEGGPFGLRIAADAKDISVSLTDVYFVGPFMYDSLLFQEVNANINITHWENVRSATIVNGELVPGALIPPPFPVEGGDSSAGLTTIDHFSNDSGTAGDGITNDKTLTLTGTAAANSTVKVFDGTAQVGSATANGSGAWSLTTSTLADGNHNLTAKATSTAGQTSAASAVLAVKIDSVAPNAPVETGDSIVNGNLVTLTGTAEANSAVKVFDGTTVVGTATNSSGAWTVTTAALATGAHALTATATDAAGNVSAVSAPLDPVIGAPTTPTTPTTPTPPSSLTAPKIVSFTNDSGKAGDHITNDSTLTVAGTAAANSIVKVFDGAKQVGTATANSSGAWNYTTATLADGDHSLTAKTADSAGHTSAASAALAVTIDTHAPTAPTIGAFSPNTTNSIGTVTGSDHLALSGTAEANSSINIFDGGKQIGSATTNGSGIWKYDTGTLTDGAHSFMSKAVDVAGNTSAASASLTETVNSHAGTSGVTFTSLYQSWNDTVTFKGTADAYSQVKIYDGNNSGALGTVKAGADGTWSIKTASAVSDTVHNFTAKVTDGGVTTSSSAVFGTTGNDTLKSSSGNDLLSGHGGNDTFVFAPNFGKDVINDFQASGRSHDVVQFSKSVFDNFADVLSHASQVGQDVVIADHQSETLTLKNVKLAALDHYDFHFA